MIQGRRLLHIALVFILLLGGLALVGTFRRSYVAETGMTTLERRISDRLGADVTIGRIRGGLRKGIELQDVVVRTKSGTELRVRSLAIEYSVGDLLRSPRTVDEVRLVEPRLLLARAEDEGGSKGLRFPSLPVGVERLVVENGSVERGNVGARGLSLRGSVGAGAAIDLGIEWLRGELVLPSERRVPFQMAGRARLGPAEACSLAVSVDGAGSRLTGWGSFSLGSRVSGGGEVRFAPLDLGALLRLAGREEAPAASVEGSLRFRGAVDSLALAAEASGMVKTFAVDHLMARALLRDRALSVDSVALEGGGSALRGDGFFDLAGKGTSRLALEFEHVDPGRYAEALAERTFDLNGFLTWEGTGRDLRDLAGSIGVRLLRSEAAGIAIREADLRGAAVRGGIAVDTSLVRTGTAELRFSGFLGYDGALRGSVRGAVPSLAELAEAARIEPLSGAASFAGEVEGDVGSLRGKGSAVVEGATVGPFAFERAIAEGELERGAGAVSGTLRVRMAGGEVEGRSFDSLAADLRLEGDHLRIERASGRRGAWTAVASGALRRDGGDERMELDDLVLRSEDTTVVRTGKVAVRRGGGRIELEPVEFAFGGGRVRASGWRDESGAMGGDVRVMGSDLRRLGRRQPLAAPLLAAVDLEASFGVSDSMRAGVVHIRSVPPEALGFPARSVEASARLRGEAWTVDSLVVRGAGDEERLRASGSVEPKGDGESALSATIRATALPVADLRPFTSTVNDLDGDLDGDIALTGTLEHPRIRGALGLRNGAYRHYAVGSVRVDSLGAAGDSLLFALHFGAARGERNRISGRLPVRVNLRDGTFVLLREDAMRVDFHVPAGDLRSLALLLGRGDEAIGSFRWEATLRGTPARPDLNGTFETQDALVFPADVSFFFERTDARLLLDEDYITIVSMEARSGKRGRVHAWGRVDLESFQLAGYDISFHAQDYDMTLADNIEVRFDGDLSLRPDSTILRRAVPHVAGRAEIRGALVTQEFGAEEVGPSVLDPSDAPEWTCDIFLRAPRNLWVRNSLVDVELSGEAQVRRSDQGLGALGRFEVLRGSYYIYPNEFRIRTGEVTFTNADDLRQSEIDVTAETRVLGEKIEVHAYGGAEDIRVEPTSESGYSESEILSMLTLRNRPEESVESGEVLSSWFQTFASRLSREMSKGLGDIGTIEIGTSEDLPELRYGNYVSSDLYVGFSQKIDAGLYRPEQERSPTQEYLAIPDRELRVEYRLRRSLLVEGEVGTLRSGERFLNLDLKVRVSY